MLTSKYNTNFLNKFITNQIDSKINNINKEKEEEKENTKETNLPNETEASPTADNKRKLNFEQLNQIILSPRSKQAGKITHSNSKSLLIGNLNYTKNLFSNKIASQMDKNNEIKINRNHIMETILNSNKNNNNNIKSKNKILNIRVSSPKQNIQRQPLSRPLSELSNPKETSFKEKIFDNNNNKFTYNPSMNNLNRIKNNYKNNNSRNNIILSSPRSTREFSPRYAQSSKSTVTSFNPQKKINSNSITILNARKKEVKKNYSTSNKLLNSYYNTKKSLNIKNNVKSKHNLNSSSNNNNNGNINSNLNDDNKTNKRPLSIDFKNFENKKQTQLKLNNFIENNENSNNYNNKEIDPLYLDSSRQYKNFSNKNTIEDKENLNANTNNNKNNIINTSNNILNPNNNNNNNNNINNNVNLNSENTLFFESPLVKHKIESDKNSNIFLNSNNSINYNFKAASGNDSKNELIQLISFLNNSSDYKPTLSSSTAFPNLITQNNINNLNINTNINTIPNTSINNNNNNNNSSSNFNLNTIENIIINTNLNLNNNNNNNNSKKVFSDLLNEYPNYHLNKKENKNIILPMDQNNYINSDDNNKLTFSQNSNAFKDSQCLYNTKNTKAAKQQHPNLLKNNYINDYLKRNHLKSSSFSDYNSNLLSKNINNLVRNNTRSPLTNQFFTNNNYNHNDNNVDFNSKAGNKNDFSDYKDTRKFLNNINQEAEIFKDSKSVDFDNKYSAEIINLQDLIQLKEKININKNYELSENKNIIFSKNKTLNANENFNAKANNKTIKDDYNYNFQSGAKIKAEENAYLNLKLNFIGDNNKDLLLQNVNNFEKENDALENKRDGSADIMMHNKYKNLLDKFSNK